jgi:hypothetical protein
MSFNVSEFRSQLVGGGARGALFQVQITNPILGVADFKTPFMVETASIPGSTVGQIQVPYFGRVVKYAGDRVFDDWTVTVINDEDFLVRNALEAWSNALNSHISNTRAYASEYKAQAQITQFGKDGTPVREYTFEGLFPGQISEIQTSWGEQDTIERFQVVFHYDLWRISGGNTGNPIT